MAIEFDPAKDVENLAKHGVSLGEVEEFDFDLAIVVEDKSEAYGEQRFVAVGPIGNRVYVLAYAERGDDLRPISLRPAEPRERRGWINWLRSR